MENKFDSKKIIKDLNRQIDEEYEMTPDEIAEKYKKESDANKFDPKKIIKDLNRQIDEEYEMTPDEIAEKYGNKERSKKR